MNIAFGDYSGGIVGQESNDDVVREGIEVIHAKVLTLIYEIFQIFRISQMSDSTGC